MRDADEEQPQGREREGHREASSTTIVGAVLLAAVVVGVIFFWARLLKKPEGPGGPKASATQPAR
jgi:hypothetical protein